MKKPTPACPLFVSEWYSRWPLWKWWIVPLFFGLLWALSRQISCCFLSVILPLPELIVRAGLFPFFSKDLMVITSRSMKTFHWAVWVKLWCYQTAMSVRNHGRLHSQNASHCCLRLCQRFRTRQRSVLWHSLRRYLQMDLSVVWCCIPNTIDKTSRSIQAYRCSVGVILLLAYAMGCRSAASIYIKLASHSAGIPVYEDHTAMSCLTLGSFHVRSTSVSQWPPPICYKFVCWHLIY